MKAGGYAHAKQFKRLRRVLKRQSTVLGRLLRDIERKLSGASDERQPQLRVWLERAWRICRQRPKERVAPRPLGRGAPEERSVRLFTALRSRTALSVVLTPVSPTARAFAGGHIVDSPHR